MSRRTKIVNALVSLVNTNIDGTTYTSNIYGSAENRLRFWDEVTSYPYLSITAGDSYIEYQPAAHKWNYLNIVIRVYTKGEYPEEELEQFFDDLEVLIDRNNNLNYDTGEDLTSFTITSITSDEGVMRPLAIGEINVLARYSTYSECL